MERLTYLTKDSWGIKGNIDNAVIRLAEIEDILGNEYDLDRLRELVEAERDGRCVVLPCKVGDKVYSIRSDFYNYEKHTGIQRGKVKGFEFDKTWMVWVNLEKDTPKSCVAFKVKDFGKTVFLTRKEAEAALNEMQEAETE